MIASSPDNGTLSFQWFTASSDDLNTALPISGATSPTYTFTPPVGSAYYWAAVWNVDGSKYSEAVYTNSAKLQVSVPATPSPSPSPSPPPTPRVLTPEEAEAAFREGQQYEDENDYIGAINSYKAAALAGNADAMARLGIMYYYGLGVTRDRETSDSWLEQAMQAGNVEAAGMLAKNAYSAGNFDQAIQFYTTAAELGDVNAMYELGTMYYKGTGIDKNYETAREWFSKAAEAGNGNAMYYIGNMYYYGQGVPEDRSRATLYWQRAEEILGQTLILPTE